MNGAFEIGGWSHDVGAFGAVVEGGGGAVGEMAETVPLSAGLRVHGVEVIVCVVLCQRLDFVLEDFAAEGWLVGDIEGQTAGANSVSSFSLVILWEEKLD